MREATRASEHTVNLEGERAWTLVGPLGLLIAGAAMTGLLAGLALTGGSPSPLTWYLARASGLTLYLLTWLALVSGLGLTTKLLDLLGGRRLVWDSHRLVTELAYVFLAVHMLSLAVDPAVPLGVSGVLLPFTSDVRQPWTDAGILAAFGFVVVTISFSLRRYLGKLGWRLLHYGTFPLWAMALVHGVGAGSDAMRPWAILLYAATAGVVLFLTLYRLLQVVTPRWWSIASRPEGRPSLPGQGSPDDRHARARS